jgi:tetratricopeptide (TPR) repeat protein
LTLISCASQKTFESQNRQETEADAMADESYLRWGKDKLIALNQPLANCYQGRADETLDLYKKEYLEKSKTPFYWLHIGNCFYNKGAWLKAEFFYRMTLEESKSPTIRAIALNNLGLIQFKFQQWEKGKEYLWESVRLSAKFKVPRYNLSQLYLQFGHYDRAIDLLNDQAFKGHKDIDVYFSLANAHLYKGDISKAGSYFEQIPQNKFLREDMAATYALYLIRKGDYKGASDVMSDRERSGIPEISAISDKIEQIISERMKD